MDKKLSIKDIAAQLNISITTVSFILNGKAKEKGISDRLAAKVLKHVKETGYKPNLLAKSLRTGKTKIICLLIENISDPFYASIAGFVEETAYKRGYKIIYGSTQNETAKARELLGVFRERHVDGFIITPAADMEDDIKALISDNVPVILFDRYYKTVDADYVGMDNLQSTYNAAKYLIGQNYKNIGYVTLDSDQSQMSDRLMGYTNAVNEHQLKLYIKKIPYPKVEQTGVYEITNLLKENPEIDTLFFATSYLAFKGLDVLNNLKLSIPHQMGVIAFDDHAVFKLYRPAITAVTQPVAEMSKQLVNLLLQKIEGTVAINENRQVIVPAVINIRDSSVFKP